MKKSFLSPESSFFWGIIGSIWQFLFFYIPLSFLVAVSFICYNPAFKTSYFSLMHYAKLFKPVYAHIMFRSLCLATTAVLATLCIAYPVAYYLAIKVRRFRTFWFALVIIPFWTNFLLLVYSWYFLFENEGLINNILIKLGLISTPLHLINSTFAVYVGIIYGYLPFMLLPLYSAFEAFDVRLLEASADLGASYFQTFKNIIVPLTMPGIKTGALLVFVPVFGEFVIPEILGGDKTMYVGSVITHYFLTIRDVSLGSAFTCLSALVLVGAILFYYAVARVIAYIGLIRRKS